MSCRSLLMTLVGILPPCIILFLYPRKHLLPLGLSACAWSFFMFSFQVHEKSVLLPLMPATLLLAGSLDEDIVCWVTWMNNVAMFRFVSLVPRSHGYLLTNELKSMWPLLRRDGLALQYTVMTVFSAWLMGTFHRLPEHWFARLTQLGSYAAIIALHVAEIMVGKIERLPDLWVVGNVLVCFGCFTIAWAWLLKRLWTETQEKSKIE